MGYVIVRDRYEHYVYQQRNKGCNFCSVWFVFFCAFICL